MSPLRKHFDQKIVILKAKTHCDVVSCGRSHFLKLLKCFVLKFMVLVFDSAWDATFFCILPGACILVETRARSNSSDPKCYRKTQTHHFVAVISKPSCCW